MGVQWKKWKRNLSKSLILDKMEKKYVTGIDIGSSYIKILVARITKTDEGRIITPIGGSIVPSHGISHGVVINKEKVQHSLKKAKKDIETRLGMKINEVCFTISDPKVKSFTESLNETIRNPVVITEAMVRNFEDTVKDLAHEQNPNDYILQLFPLSYVIDGENVGVDPTNLIIKRNLDANYLLVTCFSKNYEKLLEAAEPIFEVLWVIPSSLALSNFLTEEQKQAGAVAIDIGGDTTNVAIWKKGLPISLNTINRGGNDITKQITVTKNVDMKEAEALKRNNTNNNDSEISKIIESEMKKIIDEMHLIMKDIDRHCIFPGGVIICGGMVTSKNVTKLISDQIGLPVFHCSGKEVVSGKKVPFPFWGPVYGLILHSKDDFDIKRSFSIKRFFNRLFKWFYSLSKNIS